jgi:hypothetical protein
MLKTPVFDAICDRSTMNNLLQRLYLNHSAVESDIQNTVLGQPTQDRLIRMVFFFKKKNLYSDKSAPLYGGHARGLSYLVYKKAGT